MYIYIYIYMYIVCGSGIGPAHAFRPLAPLGKVTRRVNYSLLNA